MQWTWHASTRCRAIQKTFAMGRCPMRNLSLSAFAWLIATLVAAPAMAQDVAAWPNRPVRLIVPFGAGGVSDTLARNLANAFPQFAHGQPLIVENRAGGAGTLGAASVARDKPDGYTLLLTDLTPNAAAQALMPGISYDPHT